MAATSSHQIIHLTIHISSEKSHTRARTAGAFRSNLHRFAACLPNLTSAFPEFTTVNRSCLSRDRIAQKRQCKAQQSCTFIPSKRRPDTSTTRRKRYTGAIIMSITIHNHMLPSLDPVCLIQILDHGKSVLIPFRR